MIFKKISALFLSLLILLGLCSCDVEKVNSGYSGSSQIVQSSSVEENDLTYFPVVWVVDGDTIIVLKDEINTKVRLIGIDTPESVATGKNADKNCEEGNVASDFVKNLLSGSKVALEYDIEPQDKYGRDLCYVYLEDGTMLNKMLLEIGYARIMKIEPNVKYSSEFNEISLKARKDKKGFYSQDVLPWKS